MFFDIVDRPFGPALARLNPGERTPGSILAIIDCAASTYGDCLKEVNRACRLSACAATTGSGDEAAKRRD